MASILESFAPRKDVLAGTFNPEIFTANLMQMIDHYRGETDVVENIYTDPAAFFSEGTYPTEGMRQVLRNIFGRLKGKDATYPAIQRLETAFGGGKAHTLIAATHLAYRGSEIAELVRDVIAPGFLLPVSEVSSRMLESWNRPRISTAVSNASPGGRGGMSTAGRKPKEGMPQPPETLQVLQSTGASSRFRRRCVAFHPRSVGAFHQQPGRE